MKKKPKVFILCRRNFENKSYAGMLMCGHCIEIQTADYSNATAAAQALEKQMLKQGFSEYLGALMRIKVLDKFPS